MHQKVDIVIVGDGYDQLGVLVSVVPGLGDEALAMVDRRVQEVNQRFARAEQIRRVGLLPRALSVEEGEKEQIAAAEAEVRSRDRALKRAYRWEAVMQDVKYALMKQLFDAVMLAVDEGIDRVGRY